MLRAYDQAAFDRLVQGEVWTKSCALNLKTHRAPRHLRRLPGRNAARSVRTAKV